MLDRGKGQRWASLCPNTHEQLTLHPSAKPGPLGDQYALKKAGAGRTGACLHGHHVHHAGYELQIHICAELYVHRKEIRKSHTQVTVSCTRRLQQTATSAARVQRRGAWTDFHRMRCEKILPALVVLHSEMPAVWNGRAASGTAGNQRGATTQRVAPNCECAAGNQRGATTDRVAPNCEPPVIKVQTPSSAA